MCSLGKTKVLVWFLKSFMTWGTLFEGPRLPDYLWLFESSLAEKVCCEITKNVTRGKTQEVGLLSLVEPNSPQGETGPIGSPSNNDCISRLRGRQEMAALSIISNPQLVCNTNQCV